jgi:hypothetical protein
VPQTEAETIHHGLNKLLQARGYEEPLDANRRMAAAQNPGHLLEAMEESQNAAQNDKQIWAAKMESLADGQLPQRRVASVHYA